MDPTTPPKRGRKLGQLGKATVRALAMVDAGQANPHAAALACRIDPSTIYQALRRRRERAAMQCTAANPPETAGHAPGQALEMVPGFPALDDIGGA